VLTGNKNLLVTQKESKAFSPNNRKDLVIACHIPPLEKARKQGEMSLPSLSPVLFKILGWGSESG